MYTICSNMGHEESVYSLIENPAAEILKPPMYRSRYSNLVRTEYCCQKSGCYRTMGLPQVCRCPPESYLKKQSRVPISVRAAAVPKVQFASQSCPASAQLCPNREGRGDNSNACQPLSSSDQCLEPGPCGDSQPVCAPARARIPRLCCNRQKPSTPSACTGFTVIHRGKKDFVMDNALKVIRQPPKVPQSFCVDHPKGHRFEWRESGYPRKYVCREDYGMLPGYLVARKKELYEADQKAKEESEAVDMAAQSKCRHLEEMERQCLINGLKANWAETFEEFQALPLLIDSPALIKKKYDLESALKDLEKDIQLMERHNHIFVADTAKSFYLQ